MTPVFPSRDQSDDLSRTYLMRAADALASATATYAIRLMVLVTTGSTVPFRRTDADDPAVSPPVGRTATRWTIPYTQLGR